MLTGGSTPGDEVICHDSCHIVIAEAGGPAAMAGVMIKGLSSPSGIFSAADGEARLDPHPTVSRLDAFSDGVMLWVGWWVS